MPFITKERREAIAIGKSPESVGDLCYIAYRAMVSMWKENPRWTTAHTIYRSLNHYWPIFGGLMRSTTAYDRRDIQAAKELAWQVFWDRYVLPYEAEREKENGTI